MSELPTILSGEPPTHSGIGAHALVETAEGPLVVCLDGEDGLWTWNLRQDSWLKRSRLTHANEAEGLLDDYPDATNAVDTLAATVFEGQLLLAAGGDEQSYSFWDAATGKLFRDVAYEDPYLSTLTAVPGNGLPLFITATQYAELVEVWGSTFEEPLRELPHDLGNFAELAAAPGPDGSLLAAGGGWSGGVVAWDVSSGEQLAYLGTDGGRVPSVALTELGGTPAVVAAVEQELFVWSLPAERGAAPIHGPLTGHQDTITSVDTVALGDRRIAVTASRDSTVRVWDLTTGTQVGDAMPVPDEPFQTLQITMLGQRPVVVSRERCGETITVWDLEAALR